MLARRIYQLASKVYEWSFALRASVPACALPVLFSGIMFQDTFTRYDSRFGSWTEYSPLTATAKNTWPVAVFVNSTLDGKVSFLLRGENLPETVTVGYASFTGTAASDPNLTVSRIVSPSFTSTVDSFSTSANSGMRKLRDPSRGRGSACLATPDESSALSCLPS